MSAQHVDVLVRRSGHPDRRVTLEVGVAHMGRADDNDIVLSDIGVSRRHARVVVQPDGVYVEDLGSGNGTYFQGVRIGRQDVQNGDEILIDPFSLSFDTQALIAPDSGGLTGELEDVGDEDTVEVTVDPTNAPSPRSNAQLKRARLTTIRGQRLAASYQLRNDGLTIGRSEARDVILFDPAASRNHAQLEVVGDDVWLRDHGSGNGTFVNGSRVREQCLRHGDRVRVGSTEFRFEWLDGAPVEPATLPPRIHEHRVADGHPVVRKPDPAGRPVGPARSARVLVVAAAGAFAVVAVMLIGGLVAMYLIDPALKGQVGASIEGARFEVPVEARAAVSKHIKRGRRHYEDGNFLKAASQFYAAQKLVPGYPEAKRLGVLSTENLMLSTLREGLVLRNLPEREKILVRAHALRIGRQAVAGRAEPGKAISALSDVLVFSPDDAGVRALLVKLKP